MVDLFVGDGVLDMMSTTLEVSLKAMVGVSGKGQRKAAL